MAGILVKGASPKARRSVTGAPLVATSSAIVALSVASGGYSGLALGSATVVVWLLVLAVSLVQRDVAPLSEAFLAAAASLLALVAFTALSLAWATDDGSGFVDVVRLAGYLGAFVLVGLATRRGGAAEILAGIAVGVVTVSAVALISRLGGAGGGEAELAALLPAASGRLSYPIGYWNALGALMALGIAPLLWIASHGGHRAAGTLALAATPLPLLTAYLTGSRGALLAAVLGVVAFAWFAEDRRRTLILAAAALAATLPAIAAATLQDGILDGSTLGDPGRAELVVALLLLAGVAGLAVAHWLCGERLTSLPAARGSRRRRLTVPLVAVLAIGFGVFVAAGPQGLLDDLRRPSEGDGGRTPGTGIFTASGSGRVEFWRAALDAFSEAPLKGIGAGGFPSHWNRAGTMATPVRSAHSEPLELLAEVGAVGFACFLAFTLVTLARGVRAARCGGSEPAAALAVIAAGAVGFLIDWTWQIPAVVVPVLIAAALLTGPAFEPWKPKGHRGALLGMPARRLFAIACTALAVGAIWAGGVLAAASVQLEASEQALEEGQLSEAAAASRAAAAIEPWAAQPWVSLAEVERSAGNLQAAQRAVAAAIERAPDDFRPWLLSALIQAELGKPTVSVAYARRAKALAPLVLSRIVNSPAPSGSGS